MSPSREAPIEAAVAAITRPGAVKIEVRADWPGQSAMAVEQTIAAPLERALADLPGVSRLRSVSRPDQATLTLELAADADVERSRLAILERLATARQSLPADVVPQIGPDLDPDAPPVMFTLMATPGAALPLHEVTRLLRDTLLPVPGVVALELCAREPQVSVQLDARALAARSSTVAEVLTQLGDALGEPALPGPRGLSPRPLAIEELAAVGLGAEGSGLRLGDVATVSLGLAPARCDARQVGGDAALLGTLRMRRGFDAASWNMQLQPRIAELTADLAVRGFVLATPDTHRVALDLGGASSPAELARQTTVIDGALVAAGFGVQPAFIRAELAGTGAVIEAELWLTGAVEPGRLRAFEQALAVQALPVRALAESSSRVTLAIAGDDLAVLRGLADESAALAMKLPGVAQAQVRAALVPGVRAEITKDALRPGLTRSDLDRTIAAAFTGVPVATVSIGGERVPVVVTVGALETSDWTTRCAVAGSLELGEAPRTRVEQLVTFSVEEQPAQIFRADGRRTITVLLRVHEAATPAAAREQIQQAIATELRLPPGYVVSLEP